MSKVKCVAVGIPQYGNDINKVLNLKMWDDLRSILLGVLDPHALPIRLAVATFTVAVFKNEKDANKGIKIASQYGVGMAIISDEVYIDSKYLKGGK